MRNDTADKVSSIAKKSFNEEHVKLLAALNSGSSLRNLVDPDDEKQKTGETRSSGTFKIYKMLPHLKDLPEQMLENLSNSDLFALNLALAKDSKSSSKLSVAERLSNNAQSIIERPIRIQSGTDDRKNEIHTSRFLGGTSCSAQELWIQARKFLGDKGVTPIGNYDMDSIGCGGAITPRGWLEIHNPSSQDLKLKLFHLPNVGNNSLSAKKVNLQDGDEALSIGESLKEIADMESLRSALNNAREAQAVALPWNRSIAAVVGFMLNSNYLSADLQGNPKRAAITTEFIDYIFGRNALNWQNIHPFITSDEMAHIWANWKGRRASLFSGRFNQTNKKQHPKEKSNICRRFNYGDCPNQKEAECKTQYGFRLKHVCSFVDKATGKVCEEKHSKKDHK